MGLLLLRRHHPLVAVEGRHRLHLRRPLPLLLRRLRWKMIQSKMMVLPRLKLLAWLRKRKPLVLRRKRRQHVSHSSWSFWWRRRLSVVLLVQSMRVLSRRLGCEG